VTGLVDARGAALLDERGCLTAEGLGVVAAARPGTVPPELAAHVASCARCQRRLLSGPEAGFQPEARRTQAPPPWRIIVVLGACVALAALAAVLSRILSSPL
jgi:hypothetical protein